MKVWAMILGIAVLAAIGGLWIAFAQAPLATFNALAPRDGGARRVAHNTAYGEGARRTLDVYAPARAADAPIIVFFYGGSWSSGAKDEYGFVGAALAARGFVVAIPDYRLVPSVRFPDFLEDGAAAVRWAADNAAQFGGDPSRIVLVGHSAGAYNAMMLALDTRYLSAAGVDPARVRGAAGLSGPYDFYPFDVPASREAFGQAGDPLITQPVRFARADSPPLLLISGDKDTTVRPRNARSLAAKVTAAGGQAEVKIYPGVDHVTTMVSLSLPLRGRSPALADVTAFARRVTAAAPAPSLR